MANFGVDVVLPVVKDFFRTVLKTLGPHAPLHSEAKLLNWCSSEVSQDAVYHYRCLCHELTKTLSVDETFASCLNKSGYWLSVVAFWNAAMAQMWPMIIQKEQRMGPGPENLRRSGESVNGFFHIQIHVRRKHSVGRLAKKDVAKREKNTADTSRLPLECAGSPTSQSVLWNNGNSISCSPGCAYVSKIKRTNHCRSATSWSCVCVSVAILRGKRIWEHPGISKFALACILQETLLHIARFVLGTTC